MLSTDGSLVICGEGCWLGVPIFCNERRKYKRRADSSLIFSLNDSKAAARMSMSQLEGQTDTQTVLTRMPHWCLVLRPEYQQCTV